MKSAQYKQPGTVLIHPTICSSLRKVLAFERSTGLQVIVSQSGTVQAIPVQYAGGTA